LILLPPAAPFCLDTKGKEKVKSRRCFSPHQKKTYEHYGRDQDFDSLFFLIRPFPPILLTLGLLPAQWWNTPSPPGLANALVPDLCLNREAISHNGLALGAVADFGVQNCQYTTKVDAR